MASPPSPEHKRGGRRGRPPPPPPAVTERRNPLPGGNDPFQCVHCGAEVAPLKNGSARNHCPECLWSLHVDRVPGDRQETCGGLMEPVGLEGSPAGGWTILFRCRRCGQERPNRASEDDPVQPDRWDRMVELSTRPRRQGRDQAQKRGRQPPSRPSRG